MIAFLRGDRARKPQTISTAEAEPEAASGTVTADIEHGELFLRPRGDRVGDLRLRWEPGGGTERTVPAGTYAVLGYRRVATADDGVQWIWSTTSPGYRELVVEAGETAHVDVHAAPTVHARAFRARGVERVEVAFRAEKKLGHTLYRDGARIEIRWQCLDGTGAVLAEGPMAYG